MGRSRRGGDDVVVHMVQEEAYERKNVKAQSLQIRSHPRSVAVSLPIKRGRRWPERIRAFAGFPPIHMVDHPASRVQGGTLRAFEPRDRSGLDPAAAVAAIRQEVSKGSRHIATRPTAGATLSGR